MADLKAIDVEGLTAGIRHAQESATRRLDDEARIALEAVGVAARGLAALPTHKHELLDIADAVLIGEIHGIGHPHDHPTGYRFVANVGFESYSMQQIFGGSTLKPAKRYRVICAFIPLPDEEK